MYLQYTHNHISEAIQKYFAVHPNFVVIRVDFPSVPLRPITALWRVWLINDLSLVELALPQPMIANQFRTPLEQAIVWKSKLSEAGRDFR